MKNSVLKRVSAKSWLPPFKSKISARAALALAVLTLSSTGFAKSVFVKEVDAQGDANLKAPVQELVRSAVGSEPGFELTNTEAGSELQLQARLMKLGSSYLLTIDKTSGDKVLFTSKMKASSADDLDTVTGRAVRSALQGVSARESAHVDDVSQDEVARGTRRLEATRQWKLGLGPAWGRDMNTAATGTHFMLGFAWGIDPNWDLDVAWNYTGLSKSGESGASFNDFSIGAAYTFNSERSAPYVNFGLGRGLASTSGDTGLISFSRDWAHGWSGHVGAGYKFFRTSNVNIALEANYIQLFAQSWTEGRSPGVLNTAVVLSF